MVDDSRAFHEDIRKALHIQAETSPIDQLKAELFGGGTSSGNGTGRLSFEIDSAFQGKEGRDLVRDAVGKYRPYAIAIVDMQMPPGWDGVETIEHLCHEDPTLQVVICSAYSDHTWSEIVKRQKISDQLLILKGL